MEVRVDDVDGLPAHTYVSIRYGEQRRQAPFRSGEVIAFKAPDGADRAPKSYTIDVLRKVGSRQVSLAGITAMGGTLQSAGLEIPSLDISGSPITVDVTARMVQSGGNSAIANEEPQQTKRQQVARKAKEYLDEHGVQPVLNEMFAKLLENRPTDPLAYMVDFLEQRREIDAAAEETNTRDFAATPGLGHKPLPGFADGRSSEDLPDLSRHHSLAADSLRANPSLYERLRDHQTELGVSVAQCVKPGIDCPGHELMKVAGLFAGDADCYELYWELFGPIVQSLHAGWCPMVPHVDDGNPAKLTNSRIDSTGRYAVYATIETRRNFSGLRFPTCASKAERREVERLLNAAANSPSSSALRGAYLPLRRSNSWKARLGGMSAHEEHRLRGAGMLFAEPDSRMRLSAGLGRDWPDARGVLLGETQGLCAWCNEEDHLRFFARQHTVVDLKKLWQDLAKAVACVGETASAQGKPFAKSERLGYITACPTRLGSTVRISVSLKVPLLAASANLQALCSSLDLQVSQVVGPAGSVWSVTSGDSLGISEVDLLNGMIEGCAMLVDLERRLERGESIFAAMPGLGREPAPGLAADRCAPAQLEDLHGKKSALAVVLLEKPKIYLGLRKKATPSGVRFSACIKPGVDDKGDLGAGDAGVVAGDAECYESFRDLFDPVIKRLHDGFLPTVPQPHDLAVVKLSNTSIDPAGAGRGVSVLIELRRNLKGFRFTPSCTQDERREVERLVTKALMAFASKRPQESRYAPLASSQSFGPLPGGVEATEEAELLDSGALFGAPSEPYRLSAGIGREWPDARGAWLSDEGRDIAVWVNEEDHVRIRTRRSGSDIKGAFEAAMAFAGELEAALKGEGAGFAEDSRLGFVTVDPRHLGAALRCEVALNLPVVAARPELQALGSALNLQLSSAGAGGAAPLSASSSSTLGISEVDAANEVIDACARLVELEATATEGGDAFEKKLRALVPSL